MLLFLLVFGLDEGFATFNVTIYGVFLSTVSTRFQSFTSIALWKTLENQAILSARFNDLYRQLLSKLEDWHKGDTVCTFMARHDGR